jgi:hypothetical protein
LKGYTMETSFVSNWQRPPGMPVLLLIAAMAAGCSVRTAEPLQRRATAAAAAVDWPVYRSMDYGLPDASKVVFSSGSDEPAQDLSY